MLFTSRPPPTWVILPKHRLSAIVMAGTNQRLTRGSRGHHQLPQLSLMIPQVNQKLQEYAIGGNAVTAPAASCPIELSGSQKARGRHVPSRSQPWSSDEDEGHDHRGKGIGRRTRRATPTSKTPSRSKSQLQSPRQQQRERSPRRSLDRAEDRKKGATDTLRTEPLPTQARERSTRRRAPKGERDSVSTGDSAGIQVSRT